MKKLNKEFILKTLKGNEQHAVKVKDSLVAVEYARHFYGDDIEIYESAFIILLNRANNTIGWAKISQGGVVGTAVDVKIICKYAIDSLASGVILVHNHPSGNLTPSAADKQISARLKQALKLFDIQLTDSVIITDCDYYSMCDNGDLI